MESSSAPSRTAIDADLQRLESAIRELKIQYDRFFAGALPREPHELRADVERLIRRYSNTPIRKYAQRFHFNALATRFNTLSELWSKTVRTREEGDRRAAAHSAPGGEQTLARCRIQDPLKDQDALRRLHEQFLEARRKSGKPGRVAFTTFVRGVASQAERLKKKAGCREVELRLVMVDRDVKLKARAAKSKG